MAETITRADLANSIYQELGLSHAESSEIVDAFFEEVSSSLSYGEAVKLSSFGTFKVRFKKQRIGRNPKTKQEVPITARYVVTFHSSNILNDRINS